MFPLYDNTPRRSFPYINYLIIGATILAFLMQLAAADFNEYVMRYGFVASRFNPSNPATYPPILYSMFLHGGFFHIISNLWFLRIFGDNVEDVMGHFRYLVFYLVGGVIAVLAMYALDPASQVPLIGASGAIAAVIGAYFVDFRNSRIKTLLTLVFFVTIADVPAYVMLGYWFVLQLFSTLGQLATVDTTQGGVAFAAHVGGFIYGYIVAKLMNSGRYNPS